MRHSTPSVVSMTAPGRGVKRVCVVLVSVAMLVTGQTFGSAPRAVADPPAPMATISGTVVDSTTDAALANVTITDASVGSLTTTTDATGHYALTVAPGDRVGVRQRPGVRYPLRGGLGSARMRIWGQSVLGVRTA
jgi:hypothetical protein